MLVGIIVAVLGGLTVAATFDPASEEIERRVAQDFFERYWTTAPQHPDQTYGLMTDQYQADKSPTFEGYRAYFRKYRSVEVKAVHQTEHRDYFDVSLKYTLRNGMTVSETQAWKLDCPWLRSHASFLKCDAENLKISDGEPLSN